MNLILRDTVADDLPIFFEQELDPTANYMAAFTAKDPGDRAAFDTHWRKIMGDPNIITQTIVVHDDGKDEGTEGQVVGHVASFEMLGQREVTNWIGKEYWGRGFASRALALLLERDTTRPIYARAAKDNAASLRVLQKCGFVITGEDKGFANARGEEIEEYVLTLNAP